MNQEEQDAAMLAPWLWRFVLYVVGTFVAGALLGYLCACWQHARWVHLW